MAHDPLFNAEMPRWWDRTAFFIRGSALGFLFGYLFSLVVSPGDLFGSGRLVVIAVSVIVFLLPSIPKAWIEQRNRIRALRDGTLMTEIERRKTDANRLH